MLKTTSRLACASSLLLFFLLPPLGQAGEADLRAERLNAGNWNQLHPGGPDAIAGNGDWALSNGTLCAVVSDLDHESGVTAFGGILVDLGHCGQRNDQWLMSHLVPNMNTRELVRPHSIHAGYGAGGAYVTVVGRQQGLRLESRYQLDTSTPDTLMLEHTVTRIGSGEALNTLGTMLLHPSRAITPYTVSTRDREYSLGFDWLAVDRSDRQVMLAAMHPADLQVLMGAEGLAAPVSYGVLLESVRRVGSRGEVTELGNFLITGSDYSMFAVLSEKPWLPNTKPGAWDMLQSKWMDLDPGESLVLRYRITVAPSYDVAAITDRHYTGGLFRGRILSPGARLLLFDDDNRPLTSVTASGEGHFVVRLPAGTQRVRGRLVGAAGSKSWSWTIIADDVHVGNLWLGDAALLGLPRGYAMRLTFVGIDGTPDPVFYDDFSGANSGGKPWPAARQANYLSLAGAPGDVKRLQMPPGRYRVYASRGLEFSVTETELTLAAGKPTQLEVDWPVRVLETPGQVSADLHVHSGISFDSALPLRERVRSFAAAGAEYLVASEHNRLVDYRKLVERMGLGDDIHVIPGVEFTGMAYTEATPFTNGHSNAFPLAVSEREFSGGLPPHEGLRLRDLAQWARQQSPPALFQLNHPRVQDAPDPGLAYFDHLGVGQAFDPSLPLTATVNSPLLEENAAGMRDVDFDLLEVLNGHDMALYRLVRQDWFSLLLQGLRPAGSANSDSHKSSTLVAVPTNYVSVPEGLSGERAEPALLDSLRAGRFFGSNGPLLNISLRNRLGETAGIGGQLVGAEHTLEVAVRAAPWVPVNKLSVYLNGELYARRDISAGGKAIISVETERDAFVVVEVSGVADERYSAVLPGFEPLAFSNPVWIDADGDGHWQAPGL
jgi:hypothetical protein